ncbi:metallophosphoesterase [Pontibacter liquoris]|uniref:metallophosphoesterase n=1 Tax=Pontibacter liquoris TaxID=2905677 RepID=UPI001FA6AA9D|nr:metallophosphoesterase [Pontibacter liquoris]
MKKMYTPKCLPIRLLGQLLLTLLLSACVNTKPYYSPKAANWEQEKPAPGNKLLYTVFLIGDVGEPRTDGVQEPTLKLLQRMMNETGEQSATIYLGDNVYYNGLPKEGALDRKVSEERMNEQLNILKGYPGETYMIAGNHDWNHSGRGGLEAVMREQNYVNEYLDKKDIVLGDDYYVPGNGCPGPYEVRLSDNLVLIAVDSEWWMFPFNRPYGNNSGCGATSEADFLVKMEDIIEKNQGSDILVVAHHPLKSRGAHGGFFTLKDHFFPLTMLREWMYLPLPIIGSIYPFARKYGGILEDIPHPRYQAYIEGLLNIFDKYDNITYAAGHEHALEYFKHNNTPLIVSGSGCKNQFVKPGGDAEYAQRIEGFSKLLYYDNGEVWTEYWVPVDGGATGRITYRTLLYNKKPPQEKPLVQDNTDYSDSTITLAANSKYEVSGLKELLQGEHYRKEWTTPVTAPLLDMKNELGGLRPYQKGGGQQTTSLKVRNPEAREFKLRSVNKEPTVVLPEFLLESEARSRLEDQVSAQHPYGALMVPPLADAAGVFHTNPKLVYIPQTPYLRQYEDEYGNMLAMLEEDPDENHEDVASLGNATNLVGTDKVLSELKDDNDNEVDEQAFVRARLLDMLIGDWNRHEGQWRWVDRKKAGKGHLYIPVPVDRDQAFFKADGILPWLAMRKWGTRQVQNFGYDYPDVLGLNLNALTLDRTFTAKVTRQDWLRLANNIKASLTDAVIESAVQQLPESVRGISGPELVAKLKSRRDKLPQAAEQYYEHLAKAVDVAGSDKHERFLVNRLNDDQTQLTVYKLSKEGEVLDTLFKRTFYTSETKELRLYGLAGEDEFKVTGNVQKGIVVRIIGGGDEDLIVDNSHVSGPRKYTVVYDINTGNKFDFGSETKDETTLFEEVNVYDRDNYSIPFVVPRLNLGYNVDDGAILGAGVLARTQGFRKTPYATQHLLEGNYTFFTNSFMAHYNGDFRQVMGPWSILVDGKVEGPQMQRNFYGLGNETSQEPGTDEAYYRVRYERQRLSAMLYKDVTSFFKAGIGPTYDRFKVATPEAANFLVNEAVAGNLPTDTYNAEAGTFNAQHYLGVAAFLNMNVLGSSSEANPRIGMRWHNSISYSRQLGGQHLGYGNISSDFSFYITPNFPFQLTWAGRVGASHNYGNFRFYQASTLGGTDNLRGYRRTRLAGRSTIYANAEARVAVLNYNLFLTPAKFGVLGLYDVGRVYNDTDPGQPFLRSLHSGYGGGIWTELLQRNVLSLTYAVGDDDELWMLKLGFLF